MARNALMFYSHKKATACPEHPIKKALFFCGSEHQAAEAKAVFSFLFTW